jgi:hypothetical protein
VTAAYFVLRKGLRMSGSLASHSDGAPGMQTPLATGLARMSDVLLTFGFYIKKLIVPWSMFQYPAVTSASNLLFLALFGVLFVLAVRRRLHIVSFACSFTALTILPSLSVLFIGKVGADAAVRYLYLPVFGVALAAGYLVKSVRSKHTVIAGLVAVVTLLGVVAHQRNVLWKDDLSLWTYEVRENPDQAMGHVQYALALKNTKRYDEAEREINFILKNLDSLKYRKSMDIRCSMVAVEGSIAIEKQDLSAAESYFLHARDCNKDIRGVDFALGNIYLGRYLRNRDPALVEKANRFFREEAAKGGGLEIAYALGQTNELMGNAEQAVRYYEEVIETAPRSRLAYNAYMALYRLRGAQSDNALEGR